MKVSALPEEDVIGAALDAMTSREVKTVEVVFDVLSGEGDELYASFGTPIEARQYIADSQNESVEAGFGRGIYNIRRRYPAENPTGRIERDKNGAIAGLV